MEEVEGKLNKLCLFCDDKITPYSLSSDLEEVDGDKLMEEGAHTNKDKEKTMGRIVIPNPNFRKLCAFLNVSFTEDFLDQLADERIINREISCEKFLCVCCFELVGNLCKLYEEAEEIKKKILVTTGKVRDVIISQADKASKTKVDGGGGEGLGMVIGDGADSDNGNEESKTSFVEVFRTLVGKGTKSTLKLGWDDGDAEQAVTSSSRTEGETIVIVPKTEEGDQEWDNGHAEKAPSLKDLSKTKSRKKRKWSSDGGERDAIDIVVKTEEDDQEVLTLLEAVKAEVELEDDDVNDSEYQLFDDLDNLQDSGSTSKGEGASATNSIARLASGSVEDKTVRNGQNGKAVLREDKEITRRTLKRTGLIITIKDSSDSRTETVPPPTASKKKKKKKKLLHADEGKNEGFILPLLNFDETGFIMRPKKEKRTVGYPECPICKQKCQNADTHFKNFHDTTGMDPSKIKRCTVVEGCSAYFKLPNQLFRHKDAVHPECRSTPFVCNLCETEFPAVQVEEYHRHRRKCRHLPTSQQPKTEDKLNIRIKFKPNFSCPIKSCSNKAFISQVGLESHQKLHGNFECHFCEETKEYAPDLAIHELEHNEPTQQLKCSRCPSQFNDRFHLTNHFLEHINLCSLQESCPVCGEIVKSLAGLESHYFISHHVEGLEPSKIQRCDQCPAYYIWSYQLFNHKLKTHYKGKCPDCDKSFPKGQRLREHLEEFHPQHFSSFKLICDIGSCKRRFGTERELETHKNGRRHQTESQWLQCPNCEYKCIGKWKLNRHMNQDHPGNHGEPGSQPRHVCTECGKSFKTKGNLDIHSAVHATEFHVCPKCGAKIRGKYQFLAHVAKDHEKGRAAFICSECGKGFSTNHQLTKHMEFHESPDLWKYQCSECGRKCVTNQILTNHMRVHTNGPSFACQFCDEKYRFRSSLTKHLRKQHKKEQEKLGAETGGTTSEKKAGNFLSKKGSINAGVTQN